jgi:hypothetical protein
MHARVLAGSFAIALAATALAVPLDPTQPTWWSKYQALSHAAPFAPTGARASLSVGANVDASNECGPQSETFIALRNGTAQLAAGSNEIFRLPMRGYASSDGGGSWDGVDLPLPRRP